MCPMLILICALIINVNAEKLYTLGDKCTPNNEVSDGTCKLVYECPVAVRAIVHTYHHPFRRCDFMEMIEIVCCPPDGYQLTLNKTTHPPDINRVKSTTPTAMTTTDQAATKRIADKECEKIVRTSAPPLDSHIIGGVNASRGEFPHMAAIGYGEDGYEFLCGGSLISDTFILTAAHCTRSLNKIAPTIARMGAASLGGKEFNEKTDVRISDIIVHPQFKAGNKYHDLALLRLAKPVQLSVYVNPVCLYTLPAEPSVPLTITGWGRTNVTKEGGSAILLKAKVTFVNKTRCNEFYTGWRRLPNGITDEQICAGDPLGLRDTCQGDSGGPLQGLTGTDGQYRLVGITSFGRGCGSPVPGVYTRVSSYLDWIESVVWPQ